MLHYNRVGGIIRTKCATMIITVLSPCKASLSNAECDNSRHTKSLIPFGFSYSMICGSAVAQE